MELYSTLTRTISPLVTLSPDRISMFVCGPTVYDYAHLGHARTYIIFDVLARYLDRQVRRYFISRI